MQKKKCEQNWLDTRYASSLAEIYSHINDISLNHKDKETKKRPLLWFRGHEYSHYVLEPNLFRDCAYLVNNNHTYSQNHLREEYRFQSFMSRNYDKVDTRMPQTIIEWQEVMQHYFTKTRLMDWSESLNVALSFALEAFIKPVKDREVTAHCDTATPTLWLLRPVELNYEVYQSFINPGNIDIIKNALRTNCLNQPSHIISLSQKIQKELTLQKDSGIYFNLKDKHEQNMNVLISLSSLELMRSSYSGNEIAAVKSFEFNPFFYLLLRYFSDGVLVNENSLPPLAIIHPYHSPRIRAQRGVFTVFPHYIPSDLHHNAEKILQKNIPISMETMPCCIPYLHKIQILDPQRVAEELILTGTKRGDLYPDMQNTSQEMENVVE